jgi:sucrose phosphorylase
MMQRLPALSSPQQDTDWLPRVRARLAFLYPDAVETCLEQIAQMARAHVAESPPPERRLWHEQDVVLITYGDQVQSHDGPALRSLTDFLLDYELRDCLNTVHLLPFCPYSSDDGFSVIDYRRINPVLGDWDDVAYLRRRFDLMFDLVLNHCSQQHEWFQQYLAAQEPGREYFIAVDPATDLTGVTRPRSLPLLTPYETSEGTKHVWTTFSADQVDLNFAAPAVLLEMLDILLYYVRQGARMIRLDAIAYLWKEMGTSCIHRPQTHEIVRLMRDVLDAVAPHVLILTETNVPHAENVSYFGRGDEAHMVYQFSLPPLLLDAFLSQRADVLSSWLTDVCETSPGNTFFNFTASHDGVGVRPLEGLVDRRRFDALVDAVKARGGYVSTKRDAAGGDSPYELNISYFDALGEPGGADPEGHVRRFLASQAVMLALRGIPGVYFHSLVGTPNDHAGFRGSGHARRINRRKYKRRELDQILAEPSGVQRRVFDGYRRLLRVRVAQPAFHPDARQQVLEAAEPSVLAFCRTSLDGRQRIVCATNVAAKCQTVELPDLSPHEGVVDLISGRPPVSTERGLEFLPGQTMWLAQQD